MAASPDARRPDDRQPDDRRPDARSGARRRGGLFWVLLTLFVVVPLVEIYVIIQVGQTIGAWWTILLLILDSVIGTWLVKREGARTWRALRGAVEGGRMPARELADAGLVLIGGTLMVAPGFVTDVLGVSMILPLTRPLFRRLLTGLVASRLLVVPTAPANASGPQRPGSRPEGPVVRGEVVDD